MVDLQTDERWQLVQRIVSSPHFQKSTRLRELLQYIVEQTLHGNAHDLTEQHIGNALFHKPSDYSPLEDSSVRVHVRQLRLKLHEYFNEDGRNEPIILEIPKGSYAPIFRVAQKAETLSAPAEPKAIPALALSWRAMLPWALCAFLAVLCGVLAYRVVTHRTAGVAPAPTPFPGHFPRSSIRGIRHHRRGGQQLWDGADPFQPAGIAGPIPHREFLQGPEASKIGAANSRLSEYLSNSTLTSFADVADVVALYEWRGRCRPRFWCVTRGFEVAGPGP